MRAARDPLTRAVLRRIVRDESPHARLGWLVLDWAGDRVDRARLAGVVRTRIADYSPLWRTRCDCDDERTLLTGTVRRDILAPLARRGIEVVADDLL
jgi:hypothetical protein